MIELTAECAVAASGIAIKHQLAIMYAIAIEFDARFYTQDIDYKGLPNVELYAKSSRV